MSADTSIINSLGTVHAHYRRRHIDSDNRTLWNYLEKLRLDADTVTNILNIGVSDRTLTHELASRTLTEGQRQRKHLQKLGILKPSGFEVLSGLVLPLYNSGGEIVNLYGYNYRSRPHTEHFLNETGVIIAGNSTSAVIVDHPLDVIALIGCGIQHTVIYSHDGDYTFFPDNITEAHVLTRKPQLDIPQHHIELAEDNFFQHLRKHKGIELDGLLGEEKAIQTTSEPAQENPTPFSELSPLTQNGDIHTFTVEDRSYRVGGLHQNNSFESLRITLRATCQNCIHVDTLDLYRDTDRRKYIHRAAEELIVEKKIIKNDIGQLILALEDAQEQRLETAHDESKEYELTDEERQQALDFLRAPKLIGNIRDAYQQSGIIGETTNTLAAYLACTSRKLDKPLAIIIQSTSAAGKSTLMDAVLSFFPEEQKIEYSAMTGQSLYYFGNGELKHNILSISEEEGADKITYALKILQTEGKLKIASTGKDPDTGRIETQEYSVEGPVSIILTTTSIDIDEELLNRCLLLTVDETEAQTRLIQNQQRRARTLDGILAKETARATRHLMQNVQRLIRPMRIINPYADQLTFTSSSTRTRRDHEKYLTLIDTIALLHQYQREPITHEAQGRILEMIPVTPDDITAANAIAEQILGNSLHELPPQTRNLLDHIKSLIRGKMDINQMDQSSALFTRKELREYTGWSYRQVRRHLDRLKELEYIHLSKGRNGITMQYQLLVPAEDTTPLHPVQLADADTFSPCLHLAPH